MADGNPTAAPTRFDIFWWATTFRGLSALTNVALITVSVFGFDVGVEMSVEDGSVFETYSFSELGSFLATISVYYVALGFMALCAEMRWKFAAGKLRKYFGFLLYYLGRAVFYGCVGTSLLMVGHILGKLVGIALLVCGIAQLFFSCRKELVRAAHALAAAHALTPCSQSEGEGKGGTVVRNPAHGRGGSRASEPSASDIFYKAPQDRHGGGADDAALPADVAVDVAADGAGDAGTGDAALDLFGGGGSSAGKNPASFERKPSI